MHEAKASPPVAPEGDPPEDDRNLVRDPRRIRTMLQGMIEQRVTLTIQPDGRGESFPSLVLELDEEGILLDASPKQDLNALAAQAEFLRCSAQADKVGVSFQVERPQLQQVDGYAAFRVGLPEAVHRQQRREFYRLEAPLSDSPWCVFPRPGDDEPLRLRVLDISAGGVAVLLPPGQQVLELRQRHTGCTVEFPDGTTVKLTLTVRNLVTRARDDGVEQQRAGLRFEDLPRGADELIQRHIFSLERKRIARMSGCG